MARITDGSEVIALLKDAGIERQTTWTLRGATGGARGFPASMMPRPTGQCRLLDGTLILASGEKDVMGDPIQKTISINGHAVTFDGRRRGSGATEQIRRSRGHGIQPHHSNGWFAGITKTHYEDGSGRAHTVVVPGGKDAMGQWVYDEVFRYPFTHPVDQRGPAVPMDADCKMDQRQK